MTYTTASGREQLLEALGGAADQLAIALSALSEAFEQLDEQSAERLEEQLFGPVQAAYGRAQSTYAGFVRRHDLQTREFGPAPQPAPGRGLAGLLSEALAAIERAEAALAGLQDSMLPVEVGDRELRNGLGEVRRLLADLDQRVRSFQRTVGR